MRAFRGAIDAGVIHQETDVHLTLDGVVVVHHDPSIQVTHGEPVTIAQRTFDQIRSLDTANGEPVERLEDVLSKLPLARWNIDAKVDEVVDPLIHVIDQAEAWDRVVLASFSEPRLRRVRQVRAHGTFLDLTRECLPHKCHWHLEGFAWSRRVSLPRHTDMAWLSTCGH